MKPELPDFFDAEFYRLMYPDVQALTPSEARDHFLRFGINAGRVGCAVQLREHFLGLLDPQLTTLEIGPFTTPAIRGPMVAYFDVDHSAALIARAESLGHPSVDPPEIEFVSPNGDLAIVDRHFDQVFSSHCIEHQPNLIHHLQGVAKILGGGGESGRYYLLIPDKRYCFDHFIPPSSLAEVVGAHLDGHKLHTSSSLLRTMCMTTHNDPARHWAGDHGDILLKTAPASLRNAYQHAVNTQGIYVDSHAWQFTPDSFADIISALGHLELVDLDLERIYQTPLNRFEFGAVLRKRASS